MTTIESVPQETVIVSRVGETPIILELRQTQEAIGRISEIAVVNAATLPDLLATFGRGLAELNRAMSTISLEIVKVSAKCERRKAVILLDLMPTILINKGLKGSEDTRSAVLSLDENYAALYEQKEILMAIFENLKGKVKNIEHSLYSLKTICQYRVMPRYNTEDLTNTEFGAGQYASER